MRATKQQLHVQQILFHSITESFTEFTLDKYNALITGKKLFAKMLRNENSKLFFVLVY
jgi:hypothetical protein